MVKSMWTSHSKTMAIHFQLFPLHQKYQLPLFWEGYSFWSVTMGNSTYSATRAQEVEPSKQTLCKVSVSIHPEPTLTNLVSCVQYDSLVATWNPFFPAFITWFSSIISLHNIGLQCLFPSFYNLGKFRCTLKGEWSWIFNCLIYFIWKLSKGTVFRCKCCLEETPYLYEFPPWHFWSCIFSFMCCSTIFQPPLFSFHLY